VSVLLKNRFTLFAFHLSNITYFPVFENAVEVYISNRRIYFSIDT
jgi:hypothetical protein